MQKKPLLVYANPYAATDHDGIPSGSCPADPEHSGGDLAWPGAAIDTAETKLEIMKFDDRGARSPHQTTRWKFSREPVPTPNTQHACSKIRNLELIAADEETARSAGVKFEDPMKALAKERAREIAHWISYYGQPPAFALDPTLDPWPELAEAKAASAIQPLADSPTD